MQEAENVEMCRRTQDTPLTSQGENSAPESYFLRLLRQYEERMASSRHKIEEVEACLKDGKCDKDITSNGQFEFQINFYFFRCLVESENMATFGLIFFQFYFFRKDNYK